MDFRELFFAPVKIEHPVDFSYKTNLGNYKSLLDSISNVSNSCFYLLDYTERNFAYIPDNELLLCGYTVEEAERMGINFLEKILHPDDHELLDRIITKGFDFLNRVAPHDRINYMGIYDLRLVTKSGKVRLANIKFCPFIMDEKGNLILGLVRISLSTRKHPGNFCIYSTREKQLYEYSEKKQEFVKKQQKPLSSKEKEILTLMAQGYTGKQIENKISLSSSNYKYYQKSIFRKLNVSNGKEAIFLFTQMGRDL